LAAWQPPLSPRLCIRDDFLSRSQTKRPSLPFAKSQFPLPGRWIARQGCCRSGGYTRRRSPRCLAHLHVCCLAGLQRCAPAECLPIDGSRSRWPSSWWTRRRAVESCRQMPARVVAGLPIALPAPALLSRLIGGTKDEAVAPAVAPPRRDGMSHAPLP